MRGPTLHRINRALTVLAALSWLAGPLACAQSSGDAAPGANAVAAASQPAIFMQAKALYDLALRNGNVPALGPADPWVAKVLQRLDKSVDIGFDDQGIDRVFAWLREAGGVAICLDPGLAHVPRVSITQKGITIGDALKQILALSGLTMMVRDQAVFVSDHESEAIELRLYDVERLLRNMRTAGVGGAPITAERVVAFITATVCPASWSVESTGIDIRSGSTLFASTMPKVHERLSLLLILLDDRARAAVVGAGR